MDHFSQADPFVNARLRMVAEQLRDRGIRDERVLQAMAMVPRHEFVPREAWGEAYEDHPLPIGEGQTISQPYIVALMIEALGAEADDTVLEIGTGTGYEAAVLSRIAARVLTVERVASLAMRARENFARLGYRNIEATVGDGNQGLPRSAPFKRIIVAAAAPAVPEPLLQQFAENGKLVAPVGSGDVQELRLLRKAAGQITATNLCGCRFVPLIGS
jgi:protein-L-isoaspartate(D-aspartate) O-methyltransferase